MARISTTTGEVRALVRRPTPRTLAEAQARLRELEEALRASEDRFRATFEQAAVGVAHQTTDEQWLWVNQRFCDILGYPRDELLQCHLEQLTHPDDRAASRDFALRIRSGELPEYRIEKRYIRKDGTPVWAHLTVSPVHPPSGAPSYFVGFLEDITDRKRAEEAVRESEERFRRLTTVTLEGILIHDQGVVVDANPSFGRMFGYELHEILGRNVVELLAAPESRELLLHHARTGYELPYEAVGVRRDGTRVAIELMGRPATVSGRPVRVTSVRDITERKRLEEQALQLAREQAARSEAEAAASRAAFLAEASRVLGASFDYGTTLESLARLAVPALADFCMVDVAEDDAEGAGGFTRYGAAHVDPEKEAMLRAVRRFGRDVLGANPYRPVMVEGQSLLVAEISDEELLDVGHMEPAHLRMRRLLRPRSMVSVPLRSSGGRVLGALTLCSASERRYGPADLALAEELARRATLAVENARLFHEAQEATRARDDMLAIVAHDLRNPLGTILLSSELLGETVGAATGQAAKQLQVVRRAAGRMNQLIQDLLDVKRIESGGLVVERRAEPAAAIVCDAVELLRPLAAAGGLTLESAVPDDLPRIHADSARIQQVLSNLVGNAIKFTPPGGRITVRAERATPTEVRVVVSDTGPGIAPEMLPHVFSRFWQGKRSDRRGVGLGLSIAKGIIEAHDGRIWVESRPGEGTKFIFSLPTA